MNLPTRKARGSKDAGSLEDVNLWRVPPAGSKGDAWDGLIQLPQEFADYGRTRRSPRQQQAEDSAVLQWDSPLHWGAIGSWMLVAMGLVSTGPAYRLGMLIATAGLLLAALTLYLLLTVHRHCTGKAAAGSAAATALLLILLDAWQPDLPAYKAYFHDPVSRPVRIMSHTELMELTQDAMILVEALASCAQTAIGSDAVAIGVDSVNRGVDPESPHFGISTLVHPDQVDFTQPFALDYVFYRPRDLPKDPFATDPRATFGVFLTKDSILVYSPGPDRVWQINPRRPVDEDSAQPFEDLRPYLYDPAAGEDSPGDIIKIFPRTEADFDYPEALKEQLREFRRRSY